MRRHLASCFTPLQHRYCRVLYALAATPRRLRVRDVACRRRALAARHRAHGRLARGECRHRCTACRAQLSRIITNGRELTEKKGAWLVCLPWAIIDCGAPLVPTNTPNTMYLRPLQPMQPVRPVAASCAEVAAQCHVAAVATGAQRRNRRTPST
jgi:hypothetical protein